MTSRAIRRSFISYIPWYDWRTNFEGKTISKFSSKQLPWVLLEIKSVCNLMSCPNLSCTVLNGNKRRAAIHVEWNIWESCYPPILFRPPWNSHPLLTLKGLLLLLTDTPPTACCGSYSRTNIYILPRQCFRRLSLSNKWENKQRPKLGHLM